jgi:hypothetical protein
METRLMRTRLLLASLALLTNGSVWAGGRCDLDDVVGYEIVLAKPIVGFIQGGKRKPGYEGCEPDRVLVFSDNTGVRCNEVQLQHLDEPPTGYLFFRAKGDLKLCVEGELFSVLPTN